MKHEDATLQTSAGRTPLSVPALLELTAFLLLIFLPFHAGATEDKRPGVYEASILRSLRTHPKMAFSENVLRGFDQGDDTVRVIVNLETPMGFQRAANLKKAEVRASIREAVKRRVRRVTEGLDSKAIRITNEFNYQLGFSAEVTLQGLQKLLDHPGVSSVEEDAVLEAHLNQGIPLMAASEISASHGGAGLSIAICDTGIDYTHPRLGGGGFPNGNVIGGHDCGDNDDDPMDQQGHGTCCAGIAAGDPGTYGDYVGGVAHEAKLYAVKISYGSAGSAFLSDMVEGWEWCITHQNDDPDHPILIISTSFGGGRFYGTCDYASSSMTAAAANANAAGITVFASSGNDGYCDSMGWPACISHVISVGAVYDSSFGTYFPCVSSGSCVSKIETSGCSTGYFAIDVAAPDRVTSYSNTASFLDIFAPSNKAYTLDIVGSGGYRSGDYYSGFGGTSAACPYAAGAAASLQSFAKAATGEFLSAQQVRTLLTEGGDPIEDLKVAVTKPRVNLQAAAALLGDAPETLEYPELNCDGAFSITWSSVSEASAYQLQRATDASFSDAVEIYNGPDLFFDVTGMVQPGDYYFRVRADFGGAYSPWKEGHGMRVGSPDATEFLIYPEGNCEGNFEFSWLPVEGATGYLLERASAPEFSDPIQVYDGPLTGYTEAQLSPGSYYYRVSAYNACGNGSRTAGNEVTVGAEPAAPSSLQYPEDACAEPFTVSWPSLEGATSYELQRATDGTFIDAAVLYSGAETSYLIEGSEPGPHYFRVRAFNDCGSGEWFTGHELSVGTAPPAPQVPEYPEITCEESFSVSWSSVEDAGSYELQRSDNDAFSDAVTVYAGPELRFLETGLEGGYYYYRIRAVNDCGESPWTEGHVLELEEICGGPCLRPMEPGDSFQGYWTTECPATHRPLGYARYFQFTLSEYTRLEIDLTSEQDTYLYLLAGEGTDGAVVEEDDNGGEGTNSRITRLLPPGSYTVEASTYDGGVTGDLALSLVVLDSSLSECVSEFAPGQSTEGTWSPQCPSIHREGAYARYYTFTIDEAAEVRADLGSAVDSYLMLLYGAGPYGDVVAEDNDGGEGSNARITAAVPAGTYTLEATTYGVSSEGDFEIALSLICNDPIIESFTVTPESVIEGQVSQLQWSIVGAGTASISHGIGDVAPDSGQASVTPAETTLYTLSAGNACGTVQAEALLTVVPCSEPEAAYFYASPRRVGEEGMSRLYWSLSGADEVSIEPFVGTVDPGTGYVDVSPVVSTVYTLTGTNQCGEVHVEASVIVGPPQRAIERLLGTLLGILEE